MAKPPQPPLSAKETVFIKNIAKDCKCKVTREVSTRHELACKPVDLHDWFIITLEYGMLKRPINRDSLKNVSSVMVKKLLKDIIGSGVYKTITVMHMLKRENEIFTIVDFTYDGQGVLITKNLYD